MQIAGREIGPNQPPFIVAEVGCNHGGDLGRALSLIAAAKAVGADAVKFQAYTPDTITIHGEGPEFRITEGPWAGQHLWNLYAGTHTPFAWFPQIAARAKEMGIIWFASVFDTSSVDLLMNLDVPAIKIASFELVDIPLIRYAARMGKPMILSTGMASDDEIDDAISVAATAGQVALLHCMSGYPTPPGEANLQRIGDLARLVRLDAVGISDHTTGIEIPIAATVLGAGIIEKHFRLGGVSDPATADNVFSLPAPRFKEMVRGVHNAWAAMQVAPADSEITSRPLRRSLYVVADMKWGEIFTEANVRSIRPGAGLRPKELDNVLGKVATRDISYGTPLSWDMIAPIGPELIS